MKERSRIAVMISGCRTVPGLLLIICLMAGLSILFPYSSSADITRQDPEAVFNGFSSAGTVSGIEGGKDRAIAFGFISFSILLLVLACVQRRQAAKSLKAARDRYENMFKNNAVALFEEDCSDVKTEVERLKGEGITDIMGYLNANPQYVSEMAKMLKVLDVNPAALRLYGADSREELLELFGRIFTPDSLDGCKQFVAAIAEGRSSFECETVSRKLTGQQLYVILSATLPSSQEEFSRILISVVDNTERKRSLELMHRSEERFRNVFNNAASGMALVDLRGHYIRVNEALQRMLGYTAEELERKNWREVTHPEDVGLTKKMIISLIAGNHVQPVEKRYIDKQGKTVWALLNIALMLNQSRKPLYYVTQVQDISQIRAEQERTQAREERYRQIFEADLSGFYIAKPSGEVLMCNKVFADILGYSYVEEVSSLNFSRFFKEPELYSKLLHDLVDKKKLEHIEVEFIRRDGAVIHVHLNGACRFTPQGEPIEILGYLMDITRQKNLEAQLMHAQKMEAVGTMAGGLAHDFNNLLMGILGNTSLLMMDMGADHPNHDRLKDIEDYVKSGSELTRQLLGFAKGGKYLVRATNLNILIEQSTKIFARTHKNLRVHTTLEAALWPVQVDRSQIDQVLYNMYVNARQAMENGGQLFIRTKNRMIVAQEVDTHGMKPGRYVEIEVTDTGAGITQDALPRIFDPYYTTKEPSRGTGLGLASSSGIIRSYGGFINVTSSEKEGASFFIYLPASNGKPALEEDAEDTPVVTGGIETILLVDDEEIIINTVSRMILRLGYAVLTAQSGQEALDIYRSKQEKIDLVILDVVMPGMSGSETFDELRAIAPDAAILLSSGLDADGQAREILQRGCLGFIQKPFTLGQLSLKLAEIFKRPDVI